MNTGKFTLNKFGSRGRIWAIFLFCALTAIVSQAQTLKTLLNFRQAPHPYFPLALIQGLDGNLYGTTIGGVGSGKCRSKDCGVVFKMSPAGKLTTLYSFCTEDKCPDGRVPSVLVQARDGYLYGITAWGGAGDAGTIFRIGFDGKLTTLYNFCTEKGCPGGGQPADLIQGADGALYGTASAGGVNGLGTIFRITTAGTFTTLHNFHGTDGAYPSAVIQGTDGNFYGTTAEGGTLDCPILGVDPGCGTVFKMTPGGSITRIYTFCASLSCTDGAVPGALVEGSDGSFYGITYEGGFNNRQNDCYDGCGTVFELTSTGNLATLYTFCSSSDENCANGYYPASLVQGSDGNFYGSANNGGNTSNQSCPDGAGCGTLFEITPTGALTTLHTFEYSDGQFPGALVQFTDGSFYGVTEVGGSGHFGTVFSLATGLYPFVTLNPGIGEPGTEVIISGTNLDEITAVAFNGTSAKFRMVSKTVIIAKVPVGATTGYISVDTPSGTLTSNVIFRVKP
jgi:uncharacterized repeat protein (TIGR03803 family)